VEGIVFRWHRNDNKAGMTIKRWSTNVVSGVLYDNLNIFM